MKNSFLLSIAIFGVLYLQAHEVDIKKTSVLINNVEELVRDKCQISVENTTCVYSSKRSNLPFFSAHIIRYEEVGKPLMDINFIDFDLVCRVTMTFKNLFQNLYKLNVIDSTGKADPEKAKAFARLFNEKKDNDK
jgi:hypothetical protein